MIPKKIHYCWFGNKNIPNRMKNCIRTWEIMMPDYEIKKWDERNSNLNNVMFIKEAYDREKYAFVSDYIRLISLFNEGGIYLDTDVIVTRPFDDLLLDDFFTAVEYHPNIFESEKTFLLLDNNGMLINKNSSCPGIGILTAIMGSIPNHSFLKECINYYNNRHFILSDGKLDMKVNPAICAKIATKYGFRYKNEFQKFKIGDDNITIYPSSVLATDLSILNNDSYAFHYSENSWMDKTLFEKIKITLSKNKFLRKLFRKKLYKVNLIINNIIKYKSLKNL